MKGECIMGKIIGIDLGTTNSAFAYMVAGKPEVTLSGEVECDEVYVTAGHKGNPEAVKKNVVRGGETVSKGFGVAAPSKKRSRLFSG